MKISVVIPTRERGPYLDACLDTCLAVDDEDFEIVVSDNASQDGTHRIVERKQDSRVVYVNTGRRVSMRANYETALNAATGDYILFIGDDDGVLPSGMRLLRRLITDFTPDAIGWRLIHYRWPSEEHLAQHGSLHLHAKAIYGEGRNKNPSAILHDFERARIRSYKDGANLYHGCVARRVIEKVRSNGVYFNCQIPDVYASIGNLKHVERFLWVRHPLTIGGESDRSSGRAVRAHAPVEDVTARSFDMFVAEADADPIGQGLDVTFRSVDAHTFASLRLVNEHVYENKLDINAQAWLCRIMADVHRMPRAMAEHHREILAQFVTRRGMTDAFKEAEATAIPLIAKPPHVEKGRLRTRVAPFEIAVGDHEATATVATAMRMLEGILGDGYRPRFGGGRLSFSGLAQWMKARRNANDLLRRESC